LSTATPARPSREALTKLCKQIYATGRELTLQQTLTTVYRPSYGATDRVLEWIPAGARLLDVGCGTGTLLFLASVLRNLERGWGVDPKQASIDVARDVEIDAPVSFEAIERAPAQMIAGADTITLLDLLHHVPASEKPALLDHYLRNAAIGSRLIVKDVDTTPRWRAFANRVTDFLLTRSTVHYMAMGDARRYLEANGFEIIHADRWYNYVWCEYLLVGRKRAMDEAGGGDRSCDPPAGS